MDNFPRHVLIVAAVLALVLGAGLATQAAGGTARAPAVTHLVLNEVDYDNVGADNREFVEVFNGTGAPVDLADKAVVLVNGLTGTGVRTRGVGPELSRARSVPRRHGSARRSGSRCDLDSVSRSGQPDPERRSRRRRADRHGVPDARRRALLRGFDHGCSDRRLPAAGQPRRRLSDSGRGLERRRGVARPRAQRRRHGQRRRRLGVRRDADARRVQRRSRDDVSSVPLGWLRSAATATAAFATAASASATAASTSSAASASAASSTSASASASASAASASAASAASSASASAA